MPGITILLANAHPIIRSGLRSLLEREPTFTVLAEAITGREAVILADFKRPNVALLDINLPVTTSGIEAARTIAAASTGTAVLIHAVQTDIAYLSAAFEAGARGYVSADSAPADLAKAVRAVANGLLYISPSISRALVDGSDPQGTYKIALSETEKTLCCALAAGYQFEELERFLGSESEHLLTTNDEYLNTPVQWASVPDVIAISASENQRKLKNI